MTRDILLEAHGLQHTLPHGTESLHILRGVDLQLSRGDSVAILGPSGSGKSTLLSLLAGFDSPSSGQVRLAGQDLSGLDEEGRAALRARHLGFVFQSFALLPQATALDNVRVAADIAGIADGSAKAKQSLEEVGLGQRLDHRPSQLSGGEQQRVALARAFVHRPALVLADEPTGNLDQATGARIIDLLFGLNATHGTGLLLVTHDLSLAERCSRQLHLRDGQLKDGTD